jgi:uncharacterized coiled-coil protein SlyX
MHATKEDLESAVTQLRGEIAETRQELRGEIAETRQEIAETRQELRAVEKNLLHHIGDMAEHTARVVEERLSAELARHVMASEERNRDLLRSLDDRYRALPGEAAALRRDLDAHVADDTRHAGPAPDAAE